MSTSDEQDANSWDLVKNEAPLDADDLEFLSNFAGAEFDAESVMRLPSGRVLRGKEIQERTDLLAGSRVPDRVPEEWVVEVPRLPEQKRADEIEARLRLEIEPWNNRDRRIAFPFTLAILILWVLGFGCWGVYFVLQRIFGW